MTAFSKELNMGGNLSTAGRSVVITTDTAALSEASEREIELALSDLFMSLARAITDNGCSVNIDNPRRIVVTKRDT